jgi:hypothetical protein
MVWAVSLSTAELISRGLTPGHHLTGILSLIGFSNLVRPLAHSVLYLQQTNPRLALKLFRGEPAISGFDWNFSAIHSSSQTFSTVTWFGPPRDFTPASTCPWIDHPVSGLQHMTISALLRLGFPTAPRLPALNLAIYRNSPDRSTKSTLSSLNALQLLVNTGFQVLFHSPPGVLFTFPSRYFSTIGHQLVFCLGGWSPLLPAGFLVLGGTPACGPVFNVFAYGTITLSGLRFPSPHSADVCSSLPQPLPR